MAHLTAFDFHSGNSFLHRLDIRFKLPIMLGVNLATALTSVAGLTYLSVILIVILSRQSISIRRVLSEIRFFLLLLLLVFAARSFSTPGVPLFQAWSLSLTAEGLKSGGLVCWRLALVVMLGLLFIHTSRPLLIKAAIQWYFKPVPWISGRRIGLMISLMCRFIPMILDHAAEISEAQRSRAVECRKNPIFRIRVFILPLMEGVFKKADEMVDSMESRCFSENRTDPELFCHRSDWFALVVSVIVCLGISFI
ncbi:MAG: energy-coupling factor transporter transmembrane protein EcfT [SAR324 cluster bacterium]|nr:energy-coupling factor transporter transmembrane protein EcfT [SAR324 cluster bacterium]